MGKEPIPNTPISITPFLEAYEQPLTAPQFMHL